MADLREFFEAVENNEKLAEKLNEAKSPSEMAKIAQSEGYAVTEEEMKEFFMKAVSGGLSWKDLKKTMNDAWDSVGNKTEKLLNNGKKKVNEYLPTFEKKVKEGIHKLNEFFDEGND